MSDYYLLNAIAYAKSTYDIHLNMQSLTLPQQIFLLKDKLNCPVLSKLWDDFQQNENPAWLADVH